MDTSTMQVFTALLALVTLFGVVVTLVSVALANRVAAARQIAELIGASGLWLAAVVAIGATAGSLYFSEVANYLPCTLCWYQRIAMYPLAVIALIAAIRNDRQVVWYAAPIAAIGVLIAGYHSLIEWRPSLDQGVCSAAGPSCTDIWFREFGFVTLAFMALAGFIAIITFTLVAARSSQPTNETETS
jgi:disulfide bond formation protein DsbB